MEVSSLKGGPTDRPLDNEERKLLRRKVGQLNWAATQSRPDISFPVVEISTKFKQPALADLKQVNKTITKIKSTPSKLFYPRLKGDLKIITYSDASFRNLPNQISSAGGHVIFIADQNNNLAPIGWSSNKIKRVV